MTAPFLWNNIYFLLSFFHFFKYILFLNVASKVFFLNFTLNTEIAVFLNVNFITLISSYNIKFKISG